MQILPAAGAPCVLHTFSFRMALRARLGDRSFVRSLARRQFVVFCVFNHCAGALCHTPLEMNYADRDRERATI
jgi:hypothetical protein